MAAGYDAGHEEADDSGADSLICSESDGAGSENSWEEVAAAPPAAKGGGRGGGKGGGTGRGRGRGGGRGRGRSGSPAAADGGEEPAADTELTAAAVRGRAMGVRRSDGSRALTARGLEADGAKGVLKERLLQAIARPWRNDTCCQHLHTVRVVPEAALRQIRSKHQLKSRNGSAP